MKHTEQMFSIKKADAALQIAYGEVYPPLVPDTDGEFMTPHEIRKTAHNFMKNGDTRVIDIEHNGNIIEAYVVESFIARKGDTTFTPDAWVAGVYIESPDVWDLVMKGEISGFSLEGLARRRKSEMTFEIPDVVKGQTDEVEAHTHGFEVRFDDLGNYLGGVTTKADDGHYHRIHKGTATETSDGHSHRFILLEAFEYVED